MVKIEKFIKSTDSKSKASKLARRIKNIQALDKNHINIETYKEHLGKTHQPPTQIIPNELIPIKLTIRSNKKYISKLGLNKVSKIPIPQQPTKLDLINMPIIQPGNINIPNMELIEVKPNVVRFAKPTPTRIENSTIPLPTIPTTTTIPTSPTTTRATSNNMDDYIIVIPSYNRPYIIQSKTLALLNRHNINPKKITIFVANQEQYDLYKANIPVMLYNNLVVGVLGLKNQRNFIMDYYSEGTHIVQMDDDLDKIVELVVTRKSVGRGISKGTTTVNGKGKLSRKSSTRKTTKPISNLDKFIRNAFKICKEKGIFLWGVYPLSNARFMTPKVTTDLRFIVGPMWGNINRHRPDLRLTIDEKENAERTLQHWVIDHKVLRFNGVGIDTKYYKNKGGMQNEGKNRKEEALKSVYYLHQKYPQLTKIYLGKKSRVPEIKMVGNLNGSPTTLPFL